MSFRLFLETQDDLEVVGEAQAMEPRRSTARESCDRTSS